MKYIFLSFSILILICCNIYNSYGLTDNNNSDFKITKAFADSVNKYDIHDNFSEGMGRVVLTYGKEGFIDKTGKLVIPCIYNEVLSFSEGVAGVYKNWKGGYIDKTGKTIIAYQYDNISSFSEGMATVKISGKWGYIDKTGKLIVPCIYDNAASFSDGLARVGIYKGDQWLYGFIDKTGKQIIPYMYEFVGDFREGLALCYQNKKFGYINSKNEWGIPAIYESVEGFFEGLSVAKLNGKNGCINKENQWVVPCIYDRIDNFSEGYAVVKSGNKYGFLDKTGKQVIPCIYDYAKSFSEGLALVEINQKIGFINYKGELVIPCKYEPFQLTYPSGESVGKILPEGFSDGLLHIMENGKRVLIDKYGNSTGAYEKKSENIVCYIINTNNYSFESAKEVNMTQENLQKLIGIKENYKTLIIVFDSRLQTTIGARGFYENKFLDSTDLRKIANELIQKYKTRPEAFDNILGLQWGMPLEDAIHKLQEIGLYSWQQGLETSIRYKQNIAWNGVLYGCVDLSYTISNKQNKYLDEIIFLKICDNAEQAKKLRENIASSLIYKYGKEAIHTDIDKTNQFKYYEVYGSITSTELPITMTRIKLYIGSSGSTYGVVLRYNGMLQAQEKVATDNNHF